MKPGDWVRVPFGNRTLDAQVLYEYDGLIGVGTQEGEGADAIYWQGLYRAHEIERLDQ